MVSHAFHSGKKARIYFSFVRRLETSTKGCLMKKQVLKLTEKDFPFFEVYVILLKVSSVFRQAVYIAPLKALVRERMDDWKVRIEQKLGKK